VPDVELAGIEEHLLICGLCLDWVQAQEQMVRVLCDCLLRPVPKRSRRLRATLSSEGWLF
jgi:hypothetical protein